MKELEDEADLPAAHHSRVPLRHPGERPVPQVDLSLRRLRQRRDKVQDRALTRPARPHDGAELPSGNLQREPAQGVDPSLALPEDLADVVEADHRCLENVGREATGFLPSVRWSSSFSTMSSQARAARTRVFARRRSSRFTNMYWPLSSRIVRR